jgi:hypothetical protein
VFAQARKGPLDMHRAFVLSVLVTAIGVIPAMRYSLVNEPISMASVIVNL